MASHTSDPTTRIVTALRALVQVLRTGAGEATRRTGLTSAQLFVLSKLGDAPAPPPPPGGGGARPGAGGPPRRTGLTSAQLFVLSKLGDAPAPSVNALARRVHAHQSSVSVVIDRLVARRLARRTPDPADRRRRMIELTPRGRTLLRRAPRTVQSTLVRAIASLPDATRRTLAGGLEGIVRKVGGPRSEERR